MMVEKIDFDQLHSYGFETLPSQLYPQSLLSMVPNKINATNFHSAFVIKDQGRIVLYNNPNLYFENKKAVALGYFECINDPEAARVLFLEAEKEAKSFGASWLIGPMNGSTWDSYRFSLSQDTPNFFLEPYHHLYYNNLWQKEGFNNIATYTSSIDYGMTLFEHKKFKEIQDKLEKMGVIIRQMDLEKYDGEMSKIHAFCEATFQNNFLYTPISKKEFIQKYLPIKGLIDPEYVLMAEDADKNLIALYFAIKDIYNFKNPTYIIKTVSRKPNREYAGIIQLLIKMGIDKVKENGMNQMIHAFMHDDNQSINISKNFAGQVIRKYTLYAKWIR